MPWLTTIQDLSRYLLLCKTHFFILGDFKLPDINWATLTGSSNNFYDCIFQSNLTQCVDLPTYIYIFNILDLVLTNCPEHKTHLFLHFQEYQCITSDHYLITFTINFEFSILCPTSKEFLNFTKGDYSGLTEYLLNCDLTTLYNSSDVEELHTD